MSTSQIDSIKEYNTNYITQTLGIEQPISIKSKATLIFAPNRLTKQWFNEINKYCDTSKLSIKLISTITHLKKLSINDLLYSDIIIISTNIIFNPKYYQLKHEMPCYDLSNIFWYRIILDECHEFLKSFWIRSTPSKKFFHQFMYFKSQFKWGISGTVLANTDNNFSGILQFLSNNNFTDDTEAMHQISLMEFDNKMNIINNHFRMNTSESIKDIIFIPKIKEKTIFLKQSSIEKNIYNTLFNKGLFVKCLQVCTNILISDLIN